MKQLIFFVLTFVVYAMAQAQSIHLFKPTVLETRTNQGKQLVVDSLAFKKIHHMSSFTLALPSVDDTMVQRDFKKISLVTDDFKLYDANKNELTQDHSLSFFVSEQSDLVVLEADKISIQFDKNGISQNIQKKNNSYFLEKSTQPTLPAACGVLTEKIEHFRAPAKVRSRTNSTDTIGIAIDLDNESYVGLGSNTTTAQNYVFQLFAQVQNYYDMIGVPVKISELTIWDTTDPFTENTNCENLLNQYATYRNNTPFVGTFSHLLSWTSSLNCSGVAYVDVICAEDNVKIGLTAYLSLEPTIPTVSQNAITMTHELGHNFGSNHTHACVWNSNNTQIDDCGNHNLPSSEGEQGGCYTPGVSTPMLPANGTMMSYCSSINTSNPWNNQVAGVIQNGYDSRSCEQLDLAIYTGQFTNNFHFTFSNNVLDYEELGVWNVGFSDIVNPDFGIYLSADMNWSTDDYLVDSIIYTGTMMPNYFNYSIHQVVLGTTIYEEGDYYFLAVADYKDVLNETDESNNTAVFGPYFVQGYAASTACSTAFDNITGTIPSDTFHYTDSIYSDGIVEQDTAVVFKAGQTIVLKPGFHAKAGSTFSASIEACIAQAVEEEAAFAEAPKTEASFTQAQKPTPKPSEARVEADHKLSCLLMPNPASQLVEVVPYFEEQQGELSIFNTSGRTVFHRAISQSGSLVSVDVSNIPTGVYYVQLKTARGAVVEKLIVLK